MILESGRAAARRRNSEPSPSAGIVGFLSKTEQQGRWELPRRLRALAVLGKVQLDLRDAIVGMGVYEIEAVAVLGNIEIIVPPQLAVECNGDALVGNFTLQYKGRVNTAAVSPDHVIRVSGTAYGAVVTICVRGPDEDVLSKLGRRLGLRKDR